MKKPTAKQLETIRDYLALHSDRKAAETALESIEDKVKAILAKHGNTLSHDGKMLVLCEKSTVTYSADFQAAMNVARERERESGNTETKTSQYIRVNEAKA